MALGNSSLEQAMTLREMARERQGMQQQGQQAGMVPPQQPPMGAGGPPMGAGGPPMPVEPPMGAGGPPMGAGGPPMGAGGPPMPMPMPTEPPKQNLNEVLTATLPDGDSIAAKALEALTKRSKIDLFQSQGLQEKAVGNNDIMLAMQRYSQDQNAAIESGGLIGMAAGGRFSGQVPGQGHGMEDNVYMPIVERQAGSQVGTLAVSPDEYVVDAHTMSALGNGSADAGANVMDQVVEGVREKAYGTDKQPNQINGLAALRPMTERV